MGDQYSPARTKLLIPELPRSYVPRPRLVRHLDEAVADAPITLVAGFAGSGKTVLLAEFARSRSRGSVAWLSCDVTDADPRQFWHAATISLRAFGPTIGADALDLIDADGNLGDDAIASLVNDLIDVEPTCIVVIDDLHLASHSVLDPLGHLLDRLPSHIRTVLSARSDPRLPFHRWRAGGRLSELRAGHLRMDATEVGQLVSSAGVEIAAEEVDLLAERTEGWAAGVQLAALSMRHEVDPAGFVRNFAGTDRNVADFLLGEILLRQDDDVVSFLLETSVVDQLSAPLCDTLTGGTNGAEMLFRLERENLFVVPLDNEQTLYRYHHLFADFLRRLLAARYARRELDLHRAASEWWAANDDPRRAVRHAILAEDPVLVTGLLRDRMLEEFFNGTGGMLRDWIRDLNRAPAEMPTELMLEYAIVLGLVGALDDARIWLGHVETALAHNANTVIRARTEFARGLILGALGEIHPALESAQRARAIVEPGVDDLLDNALPHVLLRCYTFVDDFPAARELYEHTRSRSTAPPTVEQVLLDGIYSQVECAAGELEVANAQAERAATQLAELGTIGHFSANDILRTFATIAYENDRLDEVEILLDRCVEIVRIGRPIFLLLARLELARLANARGDAAGALAEADRAGSALGPSIRSPLSERVDAYRARLLAEHGDPQGARAITTKLTPGRARSVAEIRCHLAEKDAAGARAVLESMPPASTPRTALETALLEARIAIESTDDDTEIAVAIDRALALGRAGGFARTLADEGPELSAALARVLRRQPADPYSDTLAPILERAIAARPAQNVPLFGGVVLSERELTVLKYLATRLATREIATELFVSMNTLRTHSKNIYRKLGVDSRAGAVEAAHTLGIL